MNNAGYKSYMQWKNSRSGTAYLQYNDSKQLLKAAESVEPSKKTERRSSTPSNVTQSKKSKSNYFRKKFSKILEKPLEKVINFQLVDEKRVDVKLSFFPEPNVISIFREHQMQYNPEIKEWMLQFTNYISLFNALMKSDSSKYNRYNVRKRKNRTT